MSTLPYEQFDNTWIALTIEMDLDLIDVSRTRYTFFQLLSDIGGLYGLLVSIFAFFMGAWNFN